MAVMLIIETRHFEFRAYAESIHDGLLAMNEGFNKHVSDYPDASLEYFAGIKHEYDSVELPFSLTTVGAFVTRDDEMIWSECAPE